jgi:CRISPR/Cas system-associated endonuclease Cas1
MRDKIDEIMKKYLGEMIDSDSTDAEKKKQREAEKKEKVADQKIVDAAKKELEKVQKEQDKMEGMKGKDKVKEIDNLRSLAASARQRYWTARDDFKKKWDFHDRAGAK